MSGNPLTVGELKRQLQDVPDDYVVHSDGCDCIEEAGSVEVDQVTRTLRVMRLEWRP